MAAHNQDTSERFSKALEILDLSGLVVKRGNLYQDLAMSKKLATILFKIGMAELGDGLDTTSQFVQKMVYGSVVEGYGQEIDTRTLVDCGRIIGMLWHETLKREGNHDVAGYIKAALAP